MCYWIYSPETDKSNMATRRLFWKWHCWKSIGSFPYTYVMCHWSLNLIFKAKLKLESGNLRIQDGRQAAILRVTSLKINRLLPIATNNMHNIIRQCLDSEPHHWNWTNDYVYMGMAINIIEWLMPLGARPPSIKNVNKILWRNVCIL